MYFCRLSSINIGNDEYLLSTSVCNTLVIGLQLQVQLMRSAEPAPPPLPPASVFLRFPSNRTLFRLGLDEGSDVDDDDERRSIAAAWATLGTRRRIPNGNELAYQAEAASPFPGPLIRLFPSTFQTPSETSPSLFKTAHQAKEDGRAGSVGPIAKPWSAFESTVSEVAHSVRKAGTAYLEHGGAQEGHPFHAQLCVSARA